MSEKSNAEHHPMLGRRWRDENGDVWECTSVVLTPGDQRFEFVLARARERIEGQEG
jgi:hypothetical protein